MEKVQLTVTLELGVGTREAIAQLVHAIENHGGTPTARRNPKAKAAEEEAEETSTISIADIKAKRGKGKKKAEPEEVEEEAEEEIEEAEVEEAEEEESEEAEEESFEEEETEEDEDKLSDADLTKLKGALKAYSAKHDKKKAVAVLKKFAERSDLVKPADLPKLLKLLKV